MGNHIPTGIPPLLAKNWQSVPNHPNSFRNKLTSQFTHKHIINIQDQTQIESFKMRMKQTNPYICRVLFYHQYHESIYHVYTDQTHVQLALHRQDLWREIKIKIVEAFASLAEIYGFMKVCKQMIGADSNDHPKVWIHPDPLASRPWVLCNDEQVMLNQILAILSTIQDKYIQKQQKNSINRTPQPKPQYTNFKQYIEKQTTIVKKQQSMNAPPPPSPIPPTASRKPNRNSVILENQTLQSKNQSLTGQNKHHQNKKQLNKTYAFNSQMTDQEKFRGVSQECSKTSKLQKLFNPIFCETSRDEEPVSHQHIKIHQRYYQNINQQPRYYTDAAANYSQSHSYNHSHNHSHNHSQNHNQNHIHYHNLSQSQNYSTNYTQNHHYSLPNNTIIGSNNSNINNIKNNIKNIGNTNYNLNTNNNPNNSINNINHNNINLNKQTLQNSGQYLHLMKVKANIDRPGSFNQYGSYATKKDPQNNKTVVINSVAKRRETENFKNLDVQSEDNSNLTANAKPTTKSNQQLMKPRTYQTPQPLESPNPNPNPTHLLHPPNPQPQQKPLSANSKQQQKLKKILQSSNNMYPSYATRQKNNLTTMLGTNHHNHHSNSNSSNNYMGRKQTKNTTIPVFLMRTGEIDRYSPDKKFQGKHPSTERQLKEPEGKQQYYRQEVEKTGLNIISAKSIGESSDGQSKARQNTVKMLKDQLSQILDTPVMPYHPISKQFQDFKSTKSMFRQQASDEQGQKDTQEQYHLIKQKVEQKKAKFAQLKNDARKILGDDF